MKTLLALVSLLGVALGQNQSTTLWPSHDCTTDHRIDPDDPSGFLLRGPDGWIKQTCFPDHLVFVLQPNCQCVWPDRNLTYGDCSTVNKPVPGEPSYIYQSWNPVDNVWNVTNCHEVYPSSVIHNNDQLFFNVTSCSCDLLPDGERGNLTFGPALDCTMDIDIPMTEPLEDVKGSSIERENPGSKVWPPTVTLAPVAGRNAICFSNTRLMTWFLAGNEKPNIWFKFGLYAHNAMSNLYMCVLSDGCIMHLSGQPTVFPATFRFFYRALDASFRIDYRNGMWLCNPSLSGVGNWVDVSLSYVDYNTGPVLYVNGTVCPLYRASQEDLLPAGSNGFFKLHDTCPLSLGGDPRNNGQKYRGCMSRFQEMSGSECTAS